MKTALYEEHLSLGAKIVSFAGWEMPIQYKGIISEHLAVRNSVGLFDVSHMGKIEVSGPEAESFLDFLSTNQIKGKEDFTATYTILCQEDGGCVDDVIIYRQKQNSFFVIVNASNRQKDLNHFKKYSKDYDIQIIDHFQNHGILALQGPLAEQLLARFFPSVINLKNMHFMVENGLTISKTGYTGAGGFELYGSENLIKQYWSKFLSEGKQLGIEPAGLGARDTLRIEMGYALYGHEMNETIAANECIASWTIKWNKENFLGKQALEAINSSPSRRFAYGIKLHERGIPRESYPIFKEGKEIGYATSGTFSPCLQQGIALILVQIPLKKGDHLEIMIRGKKYDAEVVDLPFIKK